MLYRRHFWRELLQYQAVFGPPVRTFESRGRNLLRKWQASHCGCRLCSASVLKSRCLQVGSFPAMDVRTEKASLAQFSLCDSTDGDPPDILVDNVVSFSLHFYFIKTP